MPPVQSVSNSHGSDVMAYQQPKLVPQQEVAAIEAGCLCIELKGMCTTASALSSNQCGKVFQGDKAQLAHHGQVAACDLACKQRFLQQTLQCVL